MNEENLLLDFAEINFIIRTRDDGKLAEKIIEAQQHFDTSYKLKGEKKKVLFSFDYLLWIFIRFS